ncbi:hypothetical protein JYU34_009215 [Plutella xylostella]|uniref:Hexosyltransferase n=1 Tax=Plutella xylostella TaxID=51655 RepID=A0ABQ7QML5_PLUXY|nr:hypothetical protein JYU34_009215 [Plutella xylostella]
MKCLPLLVVLLSPCLGTSLIRDLYYPGHSVAHPEICPSRGTNLRVIILIASKTERLSARKAIRLTWGHYGARKDIGIAFLIGKPSRKHAKTIRDENYFHGDIIVSNNLEDSKIQTLQTFSMLEWVSTYCFNATKFLKIRDDVFVNIPLLVRFAQENRAPFTIWGNLVSYSGVKYARGTAYLMSTDVIDPLILEALKSEENQFEDFFFTGLMAQELSINLVNAEEFSSKPVSVLNVKSRIMIENMKYNDQFFWWIKQFQHLVE